MFQPARQSKTTDIIIDRIRAAILEGKLKPGDRLPPERELGEQFGVSKQTMRESLRALEHLGLITLRKGAGGGAFIVEVTKDVTIQSLANYLYFKDLTIEDLSEMRRIMEPHAARSAAIRRSDDTLARMRRVNTETRQAIEAADWEQVTQSEIAFHRLIAAETANPILILMLDFVETLLEDFKKILQPDVDFMNRVLTAHESLYQAISDGDPEVAAQSMLEHVLEVEDHLAALKRDTKGTRLWSNCLQAA